MTFQFIKTLNEVLKHDETVTNGDNFKQWFGSSKIKDENGDPLVLYHITKENFKAFIPGGKNPKLSGEAIWLTDSPTHQPAAHNVGGRNGNFKDGTQVIPLYCKMVHPLIIDDKSMLEWFNSAFIQDGNSMAPQVLTTENIKEIKSDGYDGIIFYTSKVFGSNAPSEYIVFNPNQVKSALSNSEFSQNHEIDK